MKKKSSIIKSAALLALAATISIFADFSNRKGIIDNAAALELMSSRSKCFNQYEVNDKARCLACIICEYVNGSGLTTGGYCKTGGGAERPGAQQ